MTRSDRKLAWGVFALLFVSYAYFYQAGGWNENSRFDLVRALVEDHSLAIDRFHKNTGDKSLVGDHYYSDKAPGLSFLAAPLYALLRPLAGLFAREHDFVVFASYLLTVLTVGAAGAATGALVFRAGRKLGASAEGALLAALGYGLGTMAFPLSTMMFGHQLAALVLFSAFTLAWDAKDAPSGRRTAAIALLAAASVVVEFPAFPAAAILAAYHLGPRVGKRTALFAAAALVPAVLLAAYLTSAFGSPLRVGYDALSDPASRAEMQTRGFFGIGFPRPGVAIQLLLGRRGGLFLFSPVLLLALPGFLRALLHEPESQGVTPLTDTGRRALIAAFAVVVYFVVFVSSYEWWQGGASFGSRHAAPMLPFLALPVALVATGRPRVAAVLVAISVAAMTVVTSVQPKPAEHFDSPFVEYELPAFLRGDLSASNACPEIGSSQLRGHRAFLPGRPRDAFNLGMLLGGRGHRSLVPLAGLWAASVWAFARALRERRE